MNVIKQLYKAAPAAATLSSSKQGRAANPASRSRRARTLEHPIPPAVQANWGGGFQAISPYCHRSHIETDKPKSVRFFKLILGWRHRRTTVSVYKKFMPSSFFRIDPLRHPPVHPRCGPHPGSRHHGRGNVNSLEYRRSAGNPQPGYRSAIRHWAG